MILFCKVYEQVKRKSERRGRFNSTHVRKDRKHIHSARKRRNKEKRKERVSFTTSGFLVDKKEKRNRKRSFWIHFWIHWVRDVTPFLENSAFHWLEICSTPPISSRTPDLFRSFCLQANLHSNLVEKSEILAIIEPSIHRLQDGGLSVFFVALFRNVLHL